MNTPQTPNADAPTSPFMERWAGALSDGFTVIPRALLRRQRQLKLDAGELVTLLHLISSWWEKDDHPYPAVSTLAHRTGVSVRTVQRHLGSLEAKGFITRLRGTTGNGRAADRTVTRYMLTGTAKRLTEAIQSPDSTPPPKRLAAQSQYDAGITRRASADEVFADES